MAQCVCVWVCAASIGLLREWVISRWRLLSTWLADAFKSRSPFLSPPYTSHINLCPQKYSKIKNSSSTQIQRNQPPQCWTYCVFKTGTRIRERAPHSYVGGCFFFLGISVHWDATLFLIGGIIKLNTAQNKSYTPWETAAQHLESRHHYFPSAGTKPLCIYVLWAATYCLCYSSDLWATAYPQNERTPGSCAIGFLCTGTTDDIHM